MILRLFSPNTKLMWPIVPTTNPKTESFEVVVYSKKQHFRMYCAVDGVKEYDFLIYPPGNLYLYTQTRKITFIFKNLKILPPLRETEDIENV